jgi:hypothetical protein
MQVSYSPLPLSIFFRMKACVVALVVSLPYSINNAVGVVLGRRIAVYQGVWENASQ